MWTMRVDKCHDYLMVDIWVTVDAAGNVIPRPIPVTRIQIPGRGDPNESNPKQPFTWTFRDPVHEEIDLSPWVGQAREIGMRGCIIEGDQTGDHQCDMVTEWDGRVMQRWEFDDKEEHGIVRPLLPGEKVACPSCGTAVIVGEELVIEPAEAT